MKAVIGMKTCTRLRVISALLLAASQMLSGCVSLPDMELYGGDSKSEAPVGPTLSSLQTNLKCDLWEAANSNILLSFYRDMPPAAVRRLAQEQWQQDNPALTPAQKELLGQPAAAVLHIQAAQKELSNGLTVTTASKNLTSAKDALKKAASDSKILAAQAVLAKEQKDLSDAKAAVPKAWEAVLNANAELSLAPDEERAAAAKALRAARTKLYAARKNVPEVQSRLTTAQQQQAQPLADLSNAIDAVSTAKRALIVAQIESVSSQALQNYRAGKPLFLSPLDDPRLKNHNGRDNLLAAMIAFSTAATQDEKAQQEIKMEDALALIYDPDNLLDGERQFTMKNILGEIEFAGEALYTLDVTDTGSINPSATFSRFINPAAGQIPATSVVLSVGGQYSEAAHRYIQLPMSVDFSRLVESVKGESDKDSLDYYHSGPGLADDLKDFRRGDCNHGIELAGDLGLGETLASGLMKSAQSNIAIYPATSPPPTSGASSGGGTGAGQGAMPPAIPNTYTFDQLSSQIDFTINEGVNGGPAWNLTHSKLTGGSPGLLNVSRVVKDQVLVTFVPVCIRHKYKQNPSESLKTEKASSGETADKNTNALPGTLSGETAGVMSCSIAEKSGQMSCIMSGSTYGVPEVKAAQSSPPYNYKSASHLVDGYHLGMVDGTPGWANYLPSCTDSQHLQYQVNAAAAARAINIQKAAGLSATFPQ
jgi:hypothetical protein